MLKINSVTNMRVDELDKWWATNPPPGSVAYGIDEKDKKYLAFVSDDTKPVWQPLELFVTPKRQYTYVESDGVYNVSIYHKTAFIKKDIFLLKTQAEKYISDLEESGYEIAFTKEQIQSAKERYDYMSEHKLLEEN